MFAKLRLISYFAKNVVYCYKQYVYRIREEKAKERRRIEEKRKMKEENERKAEVVQVVSIQ